MQRYGAACQRPLVVDAALRAGQCGAPPLAVVLGYSRYVEIAPAAPVPVAQLVACEQRMVLARFLQRGAKRYSTGSLGPPFGCPIGSFVQRYAVSLENHRRDEQAGERFCLAQFEFGAPIAAFAACRAAEPPRCRCNLVVHVLEVPRCIDKVQAAAGCRIARFRLVSAIALGQPQSQCSRKTPISSDPSCFRASSSNTPCRSAMAIKACGLLLQCAGVDAYYGASAC